MNRAQEESKECMTVRGLQPPCCVSCTELNFSQYLTIYSYVNLRIKNIYHHDHYYCCCCFPMTMVFFFPLLFLQSESFIIA